MLLKSVGSCLIILALGVVVSEAFFGYPSPRVPHEKKKPKKHHRSKDHVAYLETIEQRLDHFDRQIVDTFKQRFYRNDEFFQDGGPIFIYIGGEWEVEPEWLEGGFIHDMAEKYNGQLYYPEHRYYGKTKPTSDASVANLRYLTVDQALADLAHFVSEMKKESGKEDSKVIVIGGSYAGSMATWFRQKYPHLVVGAWASSAPLVAKVDLYEYKEISGKAFRDIGGEECYRLIKDGIKEAETLITNKKYDKFADLFGLCAEFEGNNYYDVAAVFCSFSDVLTGFVQYDTGSDIKDLCNELIAIDKPTDLEKFASWYQSYMSGGDRYCIESDYMATINYFRDTSWKKKTLKEGDRQWIYQTCSQFGYYQTSDSPNQPFGSLFPLDLFITACEDIFGKELFNNRTIHKNIRHTNVVFGGLDLNVENVFFTQGSIDPWRSVGLNENLNAYSPVEIIPNAAHSQDFYSKSADDSPGMAAAKNRAENLIDLWLTGGPTAPGA